MSKIESPQSYKFEPHPLISRAMQDLDQRIEEFQESVKNLSGDPAQERSSTLGVVKNSEYGGDSSAYIQGAKLRKTYLPAQVVGELFLSAADKFETSVRDFSFFDSEGRLKTSLRVFGVKDKNFAFVRRQEFRNGEWVEINFEIVHASLLGR